MQLRTEIAIDAPPAFVWKILTDQEKYHEWNPFITRFAGPLTVGSTLDVVISPPNSSDFRFRPRLVTVDPERELRWRGKVLANFLFSGEHFIELSPLGDRRTVVRHGEDFEGILLRVLGAQMGSTARGFVFMNQALKRRAEALFAATGSPAG
jgi:hypothetical protein